MRSGLWIALASSTLVVGCGMGNMKADEANLGRLSMDDKQSVFTAEHNIEVAKANQATAQRSLEEARTFADIANKEMKAAQTQLDAAQKGVVLGRETGSASTTAAGRQNITIAEKQMVAFKTKQMYAHRLVDLRNEELGLANKQEQAAEIDRSIARNEALRKGGITPREDAAKLMRARTDKESEVAAEDRKIASMNDEVNQLRVAWEQRRDTYNVAAREMGGAPAIIPAPRAPRPIAPEPLPPPTVKTPPAVPPPPM